jgi:hypothetical protein
MEHRKRRVNGLEPPYTAAQLSTWVFLPTMIIEFCAIASPLMPLAASIPVTIVLVALAAAAAYFGYQTMKVDPSDPRSLGHTESAETEQTKQCWICDIQVNTESMHCKFCNKCVDHFDHHCMCKFCSQVVYIYVYLCLSIYLSRCILFLVLRTNL